ncbi:MAG: MBL fold metallo-hydrolase [Defluviicoccus sp.]|nr:MBL fold metallo-hydrolase [Defluviicoccus sp.]MDE0274896.1 MBL fold metallo-hydrolase [Defluviicoccus sp.]
MTEADIPFQKEMRFDYGRAGAVAPGVRRIVCNNPGPFTFHGTNSYVVGEGEVAVIDPGPDDADHVEALRRAVAGETVSHVIVTHTHIDHSPATRAFARAVGAPIVGALPAPPADGEPPMEAADRDFEPDIHLADGAAIAGPGWTLTPVFTPGHMSNHHCFALAEGGILFSGDHVMGWNTTIVSPPDGDMGDYLRSLEVCIAREDALYLPGHGPPIERPRPFVRAYLKHRRMREGQILRCLEDGQATVPEMVGRMYAHLPERMRWAAGRSVLAHLEHMVETGRIACDGPPAAGARYRLP